MNLYLQVKEWAKAHNINDPKSGSMNSYALSLLVVFHLQVNLLAIILLNEIRRIFMYFLMIVYTYLLLYIYTTTGMKRKGKKSPKLGEREISLHRPNYTLSNYRRILNIVQRINPMYFSDFYICKWFKGHFQGFRDHGSLERDMLVTFHFCPPKN